MMADNEEMVGLVVQRAREIVAQYPHVLWPRALTKAAEELCADRIWKIDLLGGHGENATFSLSDDSGNQPPPPEPTEPGP